MIVRIQDLSGHYFQVDIDQDLSIRVMRRVINNLFGYKNEDYKIYYYNEPMEENRTIKFYNVTDMGIISLVEPDEMAKRKDPDWVF